MNVSPRQLLLMATLRQTIIDDTTEVFLQTDDFAETVTFLPKNGDARTLAAVVDENSELIDTDSGQVQVDRLAVECSRDADVGIDEIHLGDGIRRENDPDHRVFSWDGTIDDKDRDAGMWTLIFVRSRPSEIGGSRIQ